MQIQQYTADRAQEVADVFHQSVHGIDPDLYTGEQQEAWAPSPPDYQVWAERLSVKQPFIAIIDNRVAGFIELDPDGHIDCTYTHPDFQGRGVAGTLYDYLLREARRKGLVRLYVEASLVAKPFFERRGFALLQENKVHRNGETLINYSMEKWLS